MPCIEATDCTSRSEGAGLSRLCEVAPGGIRVHAGGCHGVYGGCRCSNNVYAAALRLQACLVVSVVVEFVQGIACSTFFLGDRMAADVVFITGLFRFIDKVLTFYFAPMRRIERFCLCIDALPPVRPQLGAEVRVHDRLIATDSRIIVTSAEMATDAVFDAIFLRQDLAKAPRDSVVFPFSVVMGFPCKGTMRKV